MAALTYLLLLEPSLEAPEVDSYRLGAETLVDDFDR